MAWKPDNSRNSATVSRLSLESSTTSTMGRPESGWRAPAGSPINPACSVSAGAAAAARRRRAAEPWPGRGQNDRRFAFEAFGQLVERAFVVPRVGHKPPALDDQFIEAAAAK
jgi:hypothetical protein